MTVETDVPTPSHSADGAAAPVAPAPAAPALPAGNPALLALITFLPSALTLGLWFIGYLDTAKLPGGMVATLALSAGLFMLVATIWAGRIGASTLAAIFGVFSAFWLSFALLVTALTSTWWAIAAGGVQRVQATYLLSFFCVFTLLTLATLRLPLAFTVGFVLVDVTFLLAFIAVVNVNRDYFTWAGVTTFAFCAVFAYVLFDGLGQDLGGKAMPMGKPLIK